MGEYCVVWSSIHSAHVIDLWGSSHVLRALLLRVLMLAGEEVMLYPTAECPDLRMVKVSARGACTLRQKICPSGCQKAVLELDFSAWRLLDFCKLNEQMQYQHLGFYCYFCARIHNAPTNKTQIGPGVMLCSRCAAESRVSAVSDCLSSWLKV